MNNVIFSGLQLFLHHFKNSNPQKNFCLKKFVAKNLKSNDVFKSQYKNVTNFTVFWMTFPGLLCLYIKSLKTEFS